MYVHTYLHTYVYRQHCKRTNSIWEWGIIYFPINRRGLVRTIDPMLVYTSTCKQIDLSMYMQVHISMQVSICRLHACTYEYTHTGTPTHVRAYRYTHKVHTYGYTHTYIHTYTHAYTHAHKSTYIWVYSVVWMVGLSKVNLHDVFILDALLFSDPHSSGLGAVT